MVMVSAIIGYVFTYLPVQYGQYIPVIGYIIPGILAYEMDKQVLNTLSSLLIVALVLKFLVIIIESV